jgi:glutamyl-tRNA reductase
MPVLVVGLSHHTAPVELRERFAFAEEAIPAVLAQLRQHGLAEEAVILSTCNRVEVYAAVAGEVASVLDRLQAFVREHHRWGEPLGEEVYRYSEPQSLLHLFRVVCGLDSMVVGETEVLGQVKRAYELSRRLGFTGRQLNKAFQKAFNVAKQVRTETNIQRGNVSVSSVAVELAERIFTDLSTRAILVIGAGDTSEKTARALVSRGVRSITVTNRSFERAAELAQEIGGRAVPFSGWMAEFPSIDIVISSTAAPHHILDCASLAPLMRQRRNRSLLLIDIAVPRDIDPEVNQMDDVYLYNIDDLQTIAEEARRQRLQEIARCEAIIRDKVNHLTGGARTPEGTVSNRLAYGP